MQHQRQRKCIISGQSSASLKEGRGSLAQVFEDEAGEGRVKGGEYRGAGGSKNETVGS